MECKYNLSQIAKTLEKLFEAGFNTEKQILNIKLEDLLKMPSIQSNEIMIIIDLKNAIKTKKLFAFLSGKDE